MSGYPRRPDRVLILALDYLLPPARKWCPLCCVVNPFIIDKACLVKMASMAGNRCRSWFCVSVHKHYKKSTRTWPASSHLDLQFHSEKKIVPNSLLTDLFELSNPWQSSLSFEFVTVQSADLSETINSMLFEVRCTRPKGLSSWPLQVEIASNTFSNSMERAH